MHSKVSNFFTCSSVLIIICLLLLICIFQMTNVHLFMCISNLNVYLLWKNSVHILPILIGVILRVVSGHRYFIVHVFQIFSPRLCCFIIFLIMFSEAQKFLILLKCNLSVFSFVACVFHVVSKKTLSNPESRGSAPLFL